MIKPQFYCLVLALLGQVCHAEGGISSSFLNPTLAPASAVWSLAGDEYRRYQQASNNRWQAHSDLTKAEYQHRWEALNNAGFRLTDFERHTGPNGPRYAGVWRKKSKQIYLVSQAQKGRTR